MENYNDFENNFYGSAPQKPFTDKSNDTSANSQGYIDSEKNIDSSEPNVPEMNAEQNQPQPTLENPNPVQIPPQQFNQQQVDYRQNPGPAQQTPDYAYNRYNDYSNPQYSGGNFPQNRPPVSNNFNGYYPPHNCNPTPQPQYNPNVPPQYNAYQPYTQAPQQPKKRVNAGLVVIIAVLSVLLLGSLSAFFIYLAADSGDRTDNNNKSFEFTIPNYGYEIPNTQPATAPVTEHEESDYSDKVDKNFKGISLESKPKDAESNKGYTAEYAFNRSSESVVGIVGYKDKITTVEQAETQGSGIIITADGYVVTNAHVIGNSKTAYILQVVTSNGETYNAGVVGYDTITDIAVLKLDNAKNLKYATFGNSEDIVLGEDIIVVGNPGGLDYQNSITKGVVSAVDRKISTSSIVKYIQTDAAINPGNSGGPILNLYGQVVGIATAKIVSEKYEGMGFAIPSATAKDIIDTLVKNGYVEGRVKIGIAGYNVSSAVASANDIPMGILVEEIAKNGPCDGTKLRVQDIITGVDDKEVHSFSDIYEILATHKPNDKVVIKYYRPSDKSTGEFEVTLAEDK